MKTELQRHSPKMQSVIMVCLLLPTFCPSPIISQIYPLSSISLPLMRLLFRVSSLNLLSSAPTANSSRPSRPKSQPSTMAASSYPGAALETSLTTSKRDSSHGRREVRVPRINFGAGVRERQSLICEVPCGGNGRVPDAQVGGLPIEAMEKEQRLH